MSAGKAVILIGAGAGLLVIALDPGVFGGFGGLWKTVKGLATNPAALKNVAAGKAPNDASQSLGDFLATTAGNSVFDALTPNPSPLHVTQGAPAEMPQRCQTALSACWNQCGSQTDYACINACMAQTAPDCLNGTATGSGGPFASYFGVHPAGVGSVIYHA